MLLIRREDRAGFIANVRLQYQWVLGDGEPVAGEWKEVTSSNAADSLEATWTIAKSESANLNGNYKLHLKSGETEDNVMDVIKNTADAKVSEVFKFDNEKPEITFDIESKTDWVKDGQPIVVTARDNYSGLEADAKLQYQWVRH